MNQWNGLLKKEWAMMKSWLYGLTAIALFLMLALGYGLFGFLGENVTRSDITAIAIIFWLFIILFFPAVILLTSFGKEFKQPDVWLHSEGSIFKLFGSKLFFAAVAGLVTLILPAILLFIYAIFSTTIIEGLPMSELFLLVGVIFYSFYGVSLLIACYGLFFGVLYQLLRPYIARFTIPVLIVLFALLSAVTQKIGATPFYEKIKTFGPIGNLSGEAFYVEKENFYLRSAEPVIYTGDILITGVAIVLLFVTASILFEKKVRL